jgi:hypothetical protein
LQLAFSACLHLTSSLAEPKPSTYLFLLRDAKLTAGRHP